MLYFYETSIHIVTHKKAIELGLGYAFETPSIGSVQVGGGPGEKAGVIFSASSASGHIRYKPDEQVWEQYPNKNGLWLGFWKEKRPGPEALAREKQFAGHLVQLSDGKNYLVPVARAVDGSSPLPRKLTREGGDWIIGDVEETYREYFAQACRVWDEIYAVAEKDDKPGEEAAITIADGSDIAAMALGLNYRIGPEEISLLGLFNTENMANVLKAAVDWPGFEELIKKKVTAEKQSSAPGPGA